MAELKSKGIKGKRENIEHDIDGLLFAYSQHQIAAQSAAEMLAEGSISAGEALAASERYKLDPRVKIILDIALKHFAKYLR